MISIFFEPPDYKMYMVSFIALGVETLFIGVDFEENFN